MLSPLTWPFSICPITHLKICRGERGAKQHIKKKTRKPTFHGIVAGFWGGFVYVFFSPTRNDPKKKKTHKQNFATHPVPGQSREFVYVYAFFLSLNEGGRKPRGPQSWHSRAAHRAKGLPLPLPWGHRNTTTHPPPRGPLPDNKREGGGCRGIPAAKHVIPTSILSTIRMSSLF